jgi:hemerythrin
VGNLKWSASHEVFVPELDDEHKEIFEAVAGLRKALAGDTPSADLAALTNRLAGCAMDHFAHEERLMRAARYDSLRWHKQQHDGVRRQVSEFAARIEQGDRTAGLALVEYLSSWLANHTRVADRMMGAFLRNERLRLGKVTFQAGTRPLDSCEWVNAQGDRFTPRVARKCRWRPYSLFSGKSILPAI